MLPDSWHSDLQDRQLAKPSAWKRRGLIPLHPGTCTGMFHQCLTSLIIFKVFDQSEVHFIAFKDHADDPQYLTAATLPETYHR